MLGIASGKAALNVIAYIYKYICIYVHIEQDVKRVAPIVS